MKKLCIISIELFIHLPHIFALLAIPTEDLLGPEVCPTGSYCTETSQCIDTHYTTKIGLPFYCGPHQEIKSKVCCIEADVHTTDDSVEDLEEGTITSSLNTELDDDEVVILSVPFTTNEGEGTERDIEGQNSIIDFANENYVDYLYNSIPEVRETDFILVDAPTPSQANPDIVRFVNINEPVQSNVRSKDPNNSPNFSIHSIPVDSEQPTKQDTRSANAYYDHQRAFTCPCEKGEKGDTGPKGEPGEPGKIIYIPVFVNTVPTNNAGVSTGVPLQFSSTQSSQNRPTQEHIPQHPNPTVVSYNVPISSNPSGMLSPIPAGVPNPITMPSQQHQLHTSTHAQQSAYQTQQQLQSPLPTHSLSQSHFNPNPTNEDLRTRLSRHSQIQMDQNQKFVKRY